MFGSVETTRCRFIYFEFRWLATGCRCYVRRSSGHPCRRWCLRLRGGEFFSTAVFQKVLFLK